MERPRISNGYIYDHKNKTWKKLHLPARVLMAGRELKQMEFLRWLVEQERIGGERDGDDHGT